MMHTTLVGSFMTFVSTSASCVSIGGSGPLTLLCGGGAGGTGEAATVTELGLDVGDNGALWHHINGEDVADGERGY